MYMYVLCAGGVGGRVTNSDRYSNLCTGFQCWYKINWLIQSFRSPFQVQSENIAGQSRPAFTLRPTTTPNLPLVLSSLVSCHRFFLTFSYVHPKKAPSLTLHHQWRFDRRVDKLFVGAARWLKKCEHGGVAECERGERHVCGGVSHNFAGILDCVRLGGGGAHGPAALGGSELEGVNLRLCDLCHSHLPRPKLDEESACVQSPVVAHLVEHRPRPLLPHRLRQDLPRNLACHQWTPWILHFSLHKTRAQRGHGYLDHSNHYSIFLLFLPCEIIIICTICISACWGFLMTMSKLIELGDTAFIVLRKQPLRFLHWWVLAL